MRNGSTIRRRQLARQLRLLREQAGLTIEAAAPALDWSSSKLSRIENAQQLVDVHGVRSMLDHYGVGGEKWTELIELTREARRPGWWRAYGLNDYGYVPLEAEATLLREFMVMYLPGLLQTEDYARAVFDASATRWTAEQKEREVTVRMIRQKRLTSDEEPLELSAIVEETVLRRPVGGPAVMRAKLERLVEAAALDTVTFHVLPTAVGAHAGMGGAFTLLSFDRLGEPDMAYVEHPMGAVHLEKDEDVARARVVFDHLRSAALGPAESVALVEGMAEKL
ncbi:helix-turn-helix transcriptional regulator [Pseudonocardia aurantiaca]|uniref:Helix-turn-helix domain-containing protein n=1 Tax=Pseudonocardia aurantiaca TaxID=75290 RepID=A0ABW4FWA5_9PSEU